MFQNRIASGPSAPDLCSRSMFNVSVIQHEMQKAGAVPCCHGYGEIQWEMASMKVTTKLSRGQNIRGRMRLQRRIALIQRIRWPGVEGEWVCERRWEIEEGGAARVVMRVSVAPFFTADKNICLDINLEARAAFPSCPAIHHLYLTPPRTTCTTYTSSPMEAGGWGGARAGLLALCCRPRLRPAPSPYWHLRQQPISHCASVIHQVRRSITGRAFITQRCRGHAMWVWGSESLTL